MGQSQSLGYPQQLLSRAPHLRATRGAAGAAASSHRHYPDNSHTEVAQRISSPTLAPTPPPTTYPAPHAPEGFCKEHQQTHLCSIIERRFMLPQLPQEDTEEDSSPSIYDTPSHTQQATTHHVTSSRKSITIEWNEPGAELKERMYMVHLPATKQGGAGDQQRLPVVVCLHGTDETVWAGELTYPAVHHQSTDGDTTARPGPKVKTDVPMWFELSDEQGVAVVYCQAQCFRADPTTSWPSWRADDFRSAWCPGRNDLVYMDAVLKDLEESFGDVLDMQRVYAVGFSNGGLFISTLMEKMGDRFAAFCNCMGGMCHIQCGALGVPFEEAHNEVTQWLDRKKATSEATAAPAHITRKSYPYAGRRVPVCIITGDHDENRSPCYRAWGTWSLLGWQNEHDLMMLDLDHTSHGFYTHFVHLVWLYFAGHTLPPPTPATTSTDTSIGGLLIASLPSLSLAAVLV
eukprot:TRINITY_DN6461_c0_g1_i1.p1 TRINITY_DN6461_c0_g1~~TRINITY_DN6461_c0_g1_i1.p1  ORF type:complete len:459 (+),score=63.79 TRINITY_DN6461_c0_g1_i1:220-1596(+)